jgi:hypothetical protein
MTADVAFPMGSRNVQELSTDSLTFNKYCGIHSRSSLRNLWTYRTENTSSNSFFVSSRGHRSDSAENTNPLLLL